MDMSFEFEWLPNNVAKTSNIIVELAVKLLFGLWFTTLWGWASDQLSARRLARRRARLRTFSMFIGALQPGQQ